MKEKYHIATIITCHNRKNKTIEALKHLFVARDKYALEINLKVFLTDDGSTDGTSNAVITEFSNENIKILKGDGNLYWAGGMRLAWNAAIEEGTPWDFYLLLNDDTFLKPNAFTELLKTHKYAINKFKQAGIYSGITSDIDGKNITYGGKKYCFPIIGKAVNMLSTGIPQLCQMTNANILLVSHKIVERIGIFDTFYQHNCADWDYGIKTHRTGFPVLITGNICGICENDHATEQNEEKNISKMSIAERKAYFESPLRTIKDVRHFLWKYHKMRYLLVSFARWLNIHFPRTYYRLSNMRPNHKI